MTYEPGSVRLDIFADPTCPACLIGHAQLDRALAARPDHPFVPVWHPYRLEPQLPPEGMGYVEYMTARHGSKDGIIAAMQPVLQQAEALHLWINPAQITRMPNTMDAMRLLLWAGPRQGAVMDALMTAFWREGGDLSDADLLAQIGMDAGMHPLQDGEGAPAPAQVDTANGVAMLAERLRGDDDRETVLRAEEHARERGVRSLPTVIVGDAHAVVGAQPIDLWEQVVAELSGPAPQGQLS